eukprot:3638443-Pyramimonas_sp.AAC.1
MPSEARSSNEAFFAMRSVGVGCFWSSSQASHSGPRFSTRCDSSTPTERAATPPTETMKGNSSVAI